MPKSFINPKSHYTGVGYSHAAKFSGQLVAVSGQVSLNERGELVGRGDFEAQAVQVFENLKKVLAAAGAGLKDVVRLGTFLADAKYLESYRAVRKRYLSEPYPASTGVIAGLVNPDFLIEIDVLALLPERRAAPRRPASRARARPRRARRR